MTSPVERSEATRHQDPSVARLIARSRERGSVTAEDIAFVTGVKVRQVQNWAGGHARPTGDRLRQLLDLGYVIDVLDDLYEPEGVVLWLHGRNRMLEDERPLDLIRRGRTEDVLVVLKQLTEGAY